MVRSEVRLERSPRGGRDLLVRCYSRQANFGGMRQRIAGAIRTQLEPSDLKRPLDQTGSIAGAPSTAPIDIERLLGLDVELLVLAALEVRPRPRTPTGYEHAFSPRARTAW